MTIEKFAEIAIYGAQALTALWGAFCVVLVFMRTTQKNFSSEESQLQFLDELSKPLKMGDFQTAIQMCEGDQRAIPQLAYLGMTHRDLGYSKIRQLMLDRFHRDVLADLDIRISWINTVIKTAPMLGLFGTVVGMMFAFGKLAAAEHVKADALANDISLALITTVVGLSVAIPLIIALANCNIQIRSLEEGVTSGLTRFLEVFREAVAKEQGRPAFRRMNLDEDISAVESPDEEPVKPRKKPPDDGEMDITPMIDVTFLLLIFFMVASHVGENPAVILPPARHGVAVPVASSTYFTIDADSERLPRIYKGDVPDPAKQVTGTPEQQEDQVLAFVKEGLNESPRKDHVVINAARRVKHRDVSRIARAIGRAGEVKLYVAVMEED